MMFVGKIACYVAGAGALCTVGGIGIKEAVSGGGQKVGVKVTRYTKQGESQTSVGEDDYVFLSSSTKVLLDSWNTGTVSLELSQVSGVKCLSPSRQENHQPLSFTIDSTSFNGLTDLSHLTLCNVLETQNSSR